MIESLIAHLFYVREVAHRAHLRTASYAAHMALGDLYDAIVDRTDALAEAWMGRSGDVLGDIPFVLEPAGEIIPTLEAQRAWIDTNRADATLAATEIQNLIDEAVAVIDAALYKLRRFP